MNAIDRRFDGCVMYLSNLTNPFFNPIGREGRKEGGKGEGADISEYFADAAGHAATAVLIDSIGRIFSLSHNDDLG